MLNDTIDILCPEDSLGLLHDANLFAKTVSALSSDRLKCRLLLVPADTYHAMGDKGGLPEGMDDIGRVAIFVERIFAHGFLEGYRQRLLLANPEWTWPRWRGPIAGLIDMILHKSAHSVALLTPLFPAQRHCRIGFSSNDPGRLVSDHALFGHYRGKSTRRHTQSLIDIWQRRGDLPPLYIQAYGTDVAFRSPRWFSDGNLHLRFHFERDEAAHFLSAARTGIHLCTSGTESFGHYINEGRAMEALVLTLDAPPMNELIDNSTGILVPVASSAPLNYGTRYEADESALEAAIDRVLSLAPAQRRAIGQNAREAFLKGQHNFRDGVRELLELMF